MRPEIRAKRCTTRAVLPVLFGPNMVLQTSAAVLRRGTKWHASIYLFELHLGKHLVLYGTPVIHKRGKKGIHDDPPTLFSHRQTALTEGGKHHYPTLQILQSFPEPKLGSFLYVYVRYKLPLYIPKTSCRGFLFSPPTCYLHGFLIVQAVIAASFWDLCPKGSLEK